MVPITKWYPTFGGQRLLFREPKTITLTRKNSI